MIIYSSKKSLGKSLTTGILKARNIAYEEIEDDREILEHEGEEYDIDDMTRDKLNQIIN